MRLHWRPLPTRHVGPTELLACYSECVEKKRGWPRRRAVRQDADRGFAATKPNIFCHAHWAQIGGLTMAKKSEPEESKYDAQFRKHFDEIDELVLYVLSSWRAPSITSSS